MRRGDDSDMTAKRAGVYCIANTTNGHEYIGSACDLDNRRTCHLTSLRRGKHHSGHLQRAFDRYGERVFSFHVLLVCEKRELLRYEQQFIDSRDPVYNVSRVAGNCLGVTRSPETREKLSRARIGNKNCVGRVLSAESRAKMSVSLSGKKASPEAKAKMSASRRGKRWRGVTDEWKRKQALAHFGKRASADTRAKLSTSLRGYYRGHRSHWFGTKRTKGQREKISAGLRTWRARLRAEGRNPWKKP